MLKTIKVNLPEYNIESQPNYIKIGKKVDSVIEQFLQDGDYIYRAIGGDDHKDMAIDELISKITELGTDKYDLERKEVCHDEFSRYDHDIQAGSFSVNNGKLILDDSYEHSSLFGDTAKKFYENVLLDRGYRVRIDLLVIYDANKLEKAKKIDPEAESARPELEDCLYKFKDPDNKKDALVGIVKILR